MCGGRSIIDGSGSGGSGGSSGQAGGPGSGGSPAGGSDTTSGTSGSLADASGVTLQQIALYQGVKATLMEGGGPANSNAPIVAGRDALLRLFVTADSTYDGQPLTARLTIYGGAAPIEVSSPVPGAPTDGDLDSTINLDIPGAEIQPGFSYRVELLQPAKGAIGANAGAHYPADGYAKTNVQDAGKSLKVTLVPIRYGADGSDRLPDTSAEMLEGYKNALYVVYPVPAVELTVREPVPYKGAVGPDGSGWDKLLSFLSEVRASDNAPFDAYYYGIVAPAESLPAYCGGGCTAHLANIGSAADSYARAAVALGFGDGGGEVAWDTAVHAIGHNHGLYHAPCGGAPGPDPNYPYPGGIIGVWGYNLLTKKLYNPKDHIDFMGACQPVWTSDYTWNLTLKRIKAVNGI